MKKKKRQKKKPKLISEKLFKVIKTFDNGREDKSFNNISILSEKQGTGPKFRKSPKKWIVKKDYFTKKKELN